MKKLLPLFVILSMFSCDKKVSYFDLDNQNQTYYYHNEPFTGTAFSDVEAKSPSAIYEFIDGKKKSELEYYPDETNVKIKTESHYSRGYLQSEKEYSKDGLLMEKREYVWNDTKENVLVYVEWYDWCGKMKRRKSMKCDKYFNVINVVYDQEIPNPC